MIPTNRIAQIVVRIVRHAVIVVSIVSAWTWYRWWVATWLVSRRCSRKVSPGGCCEAADRSSDEITSCGRAGGLPDKSLFALTGKSYYSCQKLSGFFIGTKSVQEWVPATMSCGSFLFILLQRDITPCLRSMFFCTFVNVICRPNNWPKFNFFSGIFKKKILLWILYIDYMPNWL